MRPTRLEISGLTAYKQKVEIDFSGLDLFAITGPTGAGKSSLVDAITYALFGQAPRVGRNVRELISQGEERLKVSLEFATNGSRYRIHRETGRRSAKPPQLERFDTTQNEWLPEEVDRVRDTNAFVENLLHMDYEAFVRSVLLPQGQFQEFLAGDRDQRRKVLDGLLQLNVYGAMQQRANAIAASHSDDADRLRTRLDIELRDATPEALKAAKSRLASLQGEVEAAAKLRDAVDAACRTAEGLGEAQRREREARESLAAAADGLGRAKELLAGGEETLKALAGRIEGVRAEMKATDYDADLHMHLSQCLPLLREAGRAAERESKLADEVAKAAPSIERLWKEASAAKNALEAARETAAAKHAAYEEARRVNAAALLRTGLKKGDPCPVCGQAVGPLDAGEHLALDRIRAEQEAAKAAEDKAQAALTGVEKRLAVSEQSLLGVEAQLKEARVERAQRQAELQAALPEPGLQAPEIELRIEALETAKRRRETLAGDEKALVEEREIEAKAIAGAQADVMRLETEAKAREKEAAAASKQAGEAASALRSAATAMSWDDVTSAIDSGRDAADLLHGRLRTADREKTRIDQEIGAQGKQIEQVEKDVGLAKELRKKEKAARETASLARDLASLLKTDRFPTFIRERALQTLAREGSRRLEEISGGRYDFEVEGQDFLIVDRWNGGETRSVRTLSGGETFLASLALALALAERLPSIGGSGAESALESLFIDEGFSHLDAETLDVVASALEVLGQDRGRLIGVITHVPALAERMPARITVHKSQAGSTVSVE